MDKSIQEAAAACRGAQIKLDEIADALSEYRAEGLVEVLMYQIRIAALYAQTAADNLYKALDK